MLVEAFAVCREGGKRVLNMRHFDVQLIGGMVLHRGQHRRDATGEGKTLVATLAVLPERARGQGRARRHGQRLPRQARRRVDGPHLRLSRPVVGVVVNLQATAEEAPAYRCDITYGQNNEFGFDYLRDNMKFSVYDYAQRDLNYAIVDEVDSILIDEARTPLIISGQAEETSTQLYGEDHQGHPVPAKDEHYVVDEKAHSVSLTDEGIDEAQKLWVKNLYDPAHIESCTSSSSACAPHALQARRELHGQRLRQGAHHRRVHRAACSPGRRWSDGLHQAVEAKGVRVRKKRTARWRRSPSRTSSGSTRSSRA
jgi:preprotein translocase subunit SecA